MASQKVHLLMVKVALARTLARPHQKLLRNYTSLRRTSMYASFLSIRHALHLELFALPSQRREFVKSSAPGGGSMKRVRTLEVST
jgi:hypothetical protein